MKRLAAVAALVLVLVHMLLDTVAAVVLGLGLVGNTGPEILAVGRTVVACLVCPCRPRYPCPFPQAKTSGPCCLLWDLWEPKLFKCERYCVERCYGSSQFAAVGETVGLVLRSRK